MKRCPPWGLAKPRTVGGALVLLGLLSGCDRGHPLGPSLENFASVTAGGNHTCGLTTGGAAFCWGENGAGELGNGSAVGPEACAAIRGTALPCSQEPVAVAGAITFSDLSAGGEYTCGLTASGAAHCWGLLALLYPYSPFPVAVAGGFPFFAVSVGNSHACGVSTGGLLYCWGSNDYGQLGNGSTSDSRVPVPVTGGLAFSAVSAGDATTEGGHTCGLTAGGEAYCWGANPFGELGNESTESSSVPLPVTGGLVFSGVSARGPDTCGLTTGGRLYCWGSNVYGQLGNGSTSDSPVPVLVTGGLTFSALTTGADYTCALTTGGAAYCWGFSYFGQLGNGSMTGPGAGPESCSGSPCSTVPLAVTGGLTFSMLSAGPGHACGVTTGGAAYCWGVNDMGQLGDGTTTNSSAPVKVAGQP